jgi:hypothetical protein
MYHFALLRAIVAAHRIDEIRKVAQIWLVAANFRGGVDGVEAHIFQGTREGFLERFAVNVGEGDELV